MKDSEIVDNFNDLLAVVSDPRKDRRKLHSLSEIFFLVLNGICAGCEGWKSIELFGDHKIDFLRRFYPYSAGVPSDDTMRRLFRRLGQKAFKAFFMKWAASIQMPEGSHIAIDGKTSRSSADKNKDPLHMVSAYVTDLELVIGQEKTSDKSNEISAIPRLIQILELRNTIISIDAMGCQREICENILAKEADYCIGLKDNQPTLKQDAIESFEKAQGGYRQIRKAETQEKGHGREEYRYYSAIEVPLEIREKHEWPGLTTFVQVLSLVKKDGKETSSSRFYISSVPFTDIKKISKVVRSHWAIESKLHWVLDTAFNEDSIKICKGNAPANIATVRHFVMNLIKKAKPKNISYKNYKMISGISDQVMLSILGQVGHF